MSLFFQGGWVVNLSTPSHFCHMSSFGGGGWVVEDISMSLRGGVTKKNEGWGKKDRNVPISIWDI